MKLELHANGVTAIKSSKTVKLGEFRDFPTVPLKTLVPNGGMATRIKLLILREYPSLYFVDDQNAKYGSKRRAITKRQFEAEQQKRAARNDTDFSAFMERSEREERSEVDPELKNVSTKKFKSLTNGCDIYEALQASNDIDYLSSIMTIDQRVQVDKHKDKIQQQRIREYRRETGETGFSKTAYRVFRASCAFDKSNNEHSCMLQLKASEELKIERGMVFEIRRPRIGKYSNDMQISELKVTTMEEIKSDQTFAALHRQMIPCKMEEIQCKNPLFPGELDLVGVIIECTPKAIYLSNMRQHHVKIESDTAWADAMLHKILKVGEVVAFQSLKLYGIRVKFEQRTSEVFVCQSKPPTMSNVLYKQYIGKIKQVERKLISKNC